ncbi:hypothetical protein CP97_14638 [Aurantiacibacter atlanticus]|uniref:Uncharacterized protein n=1 Tax=Aurantiacibacter atlanticus TaxID=1648404 RepID=A0A161IG47_9SPHN|nr:hypothetical protein CP97_14638 [Aurantiacibacter atlanticus]
MNFSSCASEIVAGRKNLLIRPVGQGQWHYAQGESGCV